MIYVWGADHHGDVVRVKGAAQAMGFDPSAVEMLIYQFVSFLRGGQPVKMSKRAGTFITLDELIDEVGTDAARFTLLMHSNDSHDELRHRGREAPEHGQPRYYVQYGHARIASILRNAEERGVSMKPIEEADLSLLSTDAELDLLRTIAELPDAGPARRGAPGPAPARALRSGARRRLPSLLHRVPGHHRRRAR